METDRDLFLHYAASDAIITVEAVLSMLKYKNQLAEAIYLRKI